jgi:hypothetical protein
MLILSRAPKAEKKRFRVRTLQGNHVSYAEVGEADADLLRQGRELHRAWGTAARDRSTSGDADDTEHNAAQDRETFLRAAVQLLRAEQEGLVGLATASTDTPTLSWPHHHHLPGPVDPSAMLTHPSSSNNSSAPKTALRIPDFLHRRATALRAILRAQRSGSGSGGGSSGTYGGGPRPPREEGIRYGWLQKACRVGRFPSARNTSKVCTHVPSSSRSSPLFVPISHRLTYTTFLHPLLLDIISPGVEAQVRGAALRRVFVLRRRALFRGT